MNMPVSLVKKQQFKNDKNEYKLKIKMKSEENSDEFQLEHFQKKIKNKLFEVMRDYLQHCETVNPIIIYFLIFIESLQILWFSIHPRLGFLSDPTILKYARAALSFVNFESPLQSNNSLLLPFVLISTSMIFIHVVTLILSIRSISTSRRRNQQISQLLSKAATYQIILLNTVLTIPIFNVSIIAVYCDQQSPYHQNNRVCYDVTHIALCILSAINLIVILTESLLYWFIFYLRNPFSKSYYALANNLFRLGKILIKLLPPLYFLVDFQSKFQNVYIFVLLIMIFLYVAFFRISSIHNFYQSYFYFQLYLESVILWFCVNLVICFQLQGTGMNFIESFLCSLLFAYTVCTVEAAVTKRFIVGNLDGTIKKQDRQKFVYFLINTLFAEASEQQVNPIVYIKILNSNLKICNEKVTKLLMAGELKTQQLHELTRQIVLLLLDKFFEDNTPSINLKIVKCKILFDSGLKILGLHQALQLRHDKLSTYEQFMIFQFKSVHHIFGSNQFKNNEDNINEIQTYLHFIQHMNDFQNELQLCAANNQQYWEQLCEDIPSVNKIYNLADKGMKYTIKIEEIFKKIQTIFPQNLTALSLYFQFLNDVCVRYKECNKIRQKFYIEKQRQKQKQLSEMDNKNVKIRFKANERMCVFKVSTVSTSIGVITNCNSEVKKYLGYEKSELINQKVTKIMPKIYAQIHDNFIRQYLQKADSIKLPVQKTVFAYKKSMRMIQTCLAVKIFPHISNGFQLVGFFKQKNMKEDYANIMINMKTYEIQGMTQGFLHLAGNRIKLSQTQKQPFKLSHLFPQLEAHNDFKQGDQIQTLFRFSDCTDKLIDLDEASSQARKKLQKKITLQVKSINNYNNTQIGVFTIKQIDDVISMHDTSKAKFSDPKIKIQKGKIKVAKKQKKSVSDGYDREQTSAQRKIQDFINSKSNSNFLCFIKILFFVCYMILSLAAISMNVYKMINNYDRYKLLQELNLSKNVSIIEGKVISLNDDIIKTANNQTSWSQYQEVYRNNLQQLKSTITTLFQKSNERKESALVINQFKQYSFKTIFKDSSKPETLSLYYTDGLLQSIFLGLQMLKKNITSFNQPIELEVEQSRYFIQENMRILLPQISMETTSAYKVLFQKNLNTQINGDILFVIIRNVIILTLYILMCVVLKHFTNFHSFIIEIYNSILKWDAYELYSKCYKFRSKSFEPATTMNDDTPRTSDLFKVFPKSLLVLLSQGAVNQNQLGVQSNHSEQKPKTSIFAGLTSSKRKGAGQENDEQSLLKSKISQISYQNKADLISLTIDNPLNKKLLLIFCVLLAFIFINIFFISLNYSLQKKFFQQRDQIINLGVYSKKFLYTYFYGIKVIQGKSEYQELYKTQLDSFYDVSQQVSSLIGDPEIYLREVYKQIQFLNSIVKGQLAGLTESQKQSYLRQTEAKLFRISDQISELSARVTNLSDSELQIQRKFIRIVKIVIQIVWTLLFCRMVYKNVLKIIQSQTVHSSNMMRMIPIWIIMKSKKLKHIIFEQSENVRVIKKAQEQSASNLMPIQAQS